MPAVTAALALPPEDSGLPRVLGRTFDVDLGRWHGQLGTVLLPGHAFLPGLALARQPVFCTLIQNKQSSESAVSSTVHPMAIHKRSKVKSETEGLRPASPLVLTQVS